MTRGDDWENDGDQIPIGLWLNTRNLAFRGKRGQTLLAELEAALLAWPSKKLAEEVFVGWEYDEDAERVLTGQACALGVLALKRGLNAEELVAEEDEMYVTLETAKTLGLSETMAWVIARANDDMGSTDEERYERMLAWVRRCREVGGYVKPSEVAVS